MLDNFCRYGGNAVSGIVYLLRIGDKRVGQPPAPTVVQTLVKLCRDDAQRVLFATTGWDLVKKEEGEERERRIKEVFTKEMGGQESPFTRVDCRIESEAWKVINDLLAISA